MKKVLKRFWFLLILVITIFLVTYYFFIHKDHWELSLNTVGTYSSSRTVELNGDGVLDIVIGGGGLENEFSEYGVIAINGKDGSLLWKIPSRNQVVGSAIFLDVDLDGIDDVFIGGRSAQFWAINGKTGQIIWEHLPSFPSMDIKNDTTLLNFFNPQLINDQDGDTMKDILVSFGGFVKATPEDNNRPAGSLMVLSAASGKVLAKAEMPDGKETYCSPVVYDFDGDGDPTVIYGSGGETINGGLYATSLSDIMKSDVSTSRKLADGNGKGFIAPPVLVDITNDSIPDVITSSFNGELMAFDGVDLNQLWHYRPKDSLEIYTTLAPLDINNDGVLDFFASFGEGTWPNVKKALQIVVNGRNGRELFRDSLGILQFSSPVLFDFTSDGHLDILLSTNYVDTQEGQKRKGLESMDDQHNHYTENRVFDLFNRTNYRFGSSERGKNLSSTPLLTDLDSDGKLDIVVCRMSYFLDLLTEKGLVIERIEVDLPATDIRWGTYMGPTYNSIY